MVRSQRAERRCDVLAHHVPTAPPPASTAMALMNLRRFCFTANNVDRRREK
jgi:hypothetical protein